MARVVPKSSKNKSGKSKSSSGKKEDLKRLLVSQVRIDVLKLFLLNPGAKYHVRAITRKVGAEINAVRRELRNLTKIGLLQKSPQKNKLNYFIKEGHPLMDELLGLIVKEEGFAQRLISGRGMGDIKFAFVSMPFLLGREAETEDVDVLVVGRVSVKKVADLIKKEQGRRGQEINYAVFSESEFEELKKRRDPLILQALLQPKVILTSGAEEYLKLS